MKAIHIAIAPSSDAVTSLTPELLAACAARTSRNNEGIEEILKLINPNDPIDVSVKRIFAFADYGHVSIKGLTGGVAVFLENISLWQIYELFRICTVSDGQETSTRYVSFDPSRSIDPEQAMVPPSMHDDYRTMLGRAAELYERLSKFWTDIATADPGVMKIPQQLIDKAEAGDEKSVAKVARLRRNYVFDRARCVIPMCTQNNMVLVQTARQWVETCAALNSHYRPEAKALGALIVEQLKHAIPNLLKHSAGTPEQALQVVVDLSEQSEHARCDHETATAISAWDDATATELHIWPPYNGWATQQRLQNGFAGHRHRYVPLGEQMGRCAVRFTINNLGMAELRDLNRHRPGHKFTWLTPVGIYYAWDQVPMDMRNDAATRALFHEVDEFLSKGAVRARGLLAAQDMCFPYFFFLGHQFRFEHTTTLDKFIYTAEIRTGSGVHYRYGAQVSSCLHQLYKLLPDLQGLVLEGSMEPE